MGNAIRFGKDHVLLSVVACKKNTLFIFHTVIRKIQYGFSASLPDNRFAFMDNEKESFDLTLLV